MLTFCRYNHHGAHRTFYGHNGWAEAILAVTAPEDDLTQVRQMKSSLTPNFGRASRCDCISICPFWFACPHLDALLLYC